MPEVPNGTPLSAISRYSAPGGPCAGRADCRFDARTILIAGSDRIDSVIAYGRTWAWRRHAGQSWSQATLEGWVPASGIALDTVERYDDERYYSGGDFAGTKAWLTEFGTECWNNPTDVENSTFMNSVLPWLDNTPGIDRHFWFTGRLDDSPSWDSCELIDHTTKQLTSYGHLYAGVRACTSLPGFTTAHGQKKLENGDGRFACWDGTYSYCGSSPNNWTQYGVQTAAEGKALGPWKCSSGWWND